MLNKLPVYIAVIVTDNITDNIYYEHSTSNSIHIHSGLRSAGFHHFDTVFLEGCLGVTQFIKIGLFFTKEVYLYKGVGDPHIAEFGLVSKRSSH